MVRGEVGYRPLADRTAQIRTLRRPVRDLVLPACNSATGALFLIVILSEAEGSLVGRAYPHASWIREAWLEGKHERDSSLRSE